MHSGDYYDDDHVNLYCMFLLCDASTFVYSLICRETDVRTIRCTNENAASVILHPYRHHGLHSLEKSPMEVSRGLFWARTYEGKRRVGSVVSETELPDWSVYQLVGVSLTILWISVKIGPKRWSKDRIQPEYVMNHTIFWLFQVAWGRIVGLMGLVSNQSKVMLRFHLEPTPIISLGHLCSV